MFWISTSLPTILNNPTKMHLIGGIRVPVWLNPTKVCEDLGRLFRGCGFSRLQWGAV